MSEDSAHVKQLKYLKLRSVCDNLHRPCGLGQCDKVHEIFVPRATVACVQFEHQPRDMYVFVGMTSGC